MFDQSGRRRFLKNLLQTGGGLLAAPAAFPKAFRNRAPLTAPPFYWGVGIENCWIAQTDPAKDGKRRLLDVFLQTQHYKKWKSDLNLAAELGVKAIRYSVPWYKAEPKPGVYDWSWIDAPVEYLVNELRIIPIMDLIHYGTPKWMEDGVGDERFPDALGRYAGAMARHFQGLVNHYSPHNEPQLTCLFCGLTGRWPPYQKSAKSWAKIGVRVAQGMVLEMKAIREAIPDAVIVSIDPSIYVQVEPYGSLAQHLASRSEGKFAEKEIGNAVAFFPSSLAYGKVSAQHPLAGFLREQDVISRDIDWFGRHATLPDILGTNSYPDIGAYSKKGTVPLVHAAQNAATDVAGALRNAQEYFSLPVYLTETSSGLTAPEKIAYIDALYAMVLEFRRQKFPLKGINWWPLFEAIQWDYREKWNKPLKDFLRPGGWNNGLFLAQIKPDGDLIRVRTAAAAAYRNVIRRDAGGRR